MAKKRAPSQAIAGPDFEPPPFDDHEAVFQIFEPGAVWESFEEHLAARETKDPEPPKLESPAFENEVLRLAEQGKTDDIVRLVRARLGRKGTKGGRPRKTKADRLRDTPSYGATSIARMVKWVLANLYPQERIENINVRATQIAEMIWNDHQPASAAPRKRRVQASTLLDNLGRSKKRQIV